MSEMSDFYAEACPDYNGVVYLSEGDNVEFASPLNAVALTSIVYIQGDGISVRTLNIPGSDAAMFAEETQGIACDCMPPAVWHFTAIGVLNEVVNFSTLDGHHALHLMHHPDHLFEPEFNHPMGIGYDLKLLDNTYTIDLVFKEMVDTLTAQGALPDDGSIKVADVSNVNLDEMYDKFMEILKEEDDA
jgi:hypothetical protein